MPVMRRNAKTLSPWFDGRLATVAAPVVERLERRQLMSADPHAHANVVQALPLVWEFDAPVNGLHDADGQDIGFTRLQLNKNGLAGSYLPANLDLRTDLGLLQITTTGNSSNGGNYNADNSLTNGVETQFDATTRGWSVTTRLKGPLDFIDQPSEQGGVMFGPDQDNYVKLVAVSQPEGTRIQLLDEQSNGSGGFDHALDNSGVGVKVDVGSFGAINTLDLRLVGDAVTGKVEGFYSINGGAFVKMPQDLVLSGAKKTAFFTAAARAGLIAMHKNDAGGITVGFDRFEIRPGAPPVTETRPSVAHTSPADGATNVPRDAFVQAGLSLPNGGVANDTLAGNVRLFRVDGAGNRTPVSATPSTSGGGDTILLSPDALLDANTRYVFEVTEGVKDVSGQAFQPFSMSFTTGTSGAEPDPTLAFERITLSNTAGEQYTSLKIGPDGKLYAGTLDGRIFRFPINANGTLGAAQVITSLQANHGGKRMLTGFTFDPASTASNLILWVSHSQYKLGTDPNGTDPELRYGDDWTGMISRLSGANLESVWNAVRGLPRSVRDHLTNQPTFGPDGALYFAQGANSSMGAPDPIWGNRPERLLTGAILRLDVGALTVGQSLDVKTEAGGTYNPFAAGVPLTVYASGVRNAYDLVWTRDGKLFAPANGSAEGGATPATPTLPIPGSVRIDGDDDGNPANGHYSNPPVPGIASTTASQRDFLFRIDQGGYYGHPNPTRYEFVAGGGHTPANGVGPNELADYGVTVQPDRNYRGFAYDFGVSISPNGVIEYQNASVFGGSLRGKLIVTRFAGPNDLLVLTRDSAGNVINTQRNVPGFTNLKDPLDVVENPANGFLYVSEYGQFDATRRNITLLRPVLPGANVEADKDHLTFSDIATGQVNGTGPSATQKVRITNTGAQRLTFGAGAFSVVDDAASPGDDRAKFQIVNAASVPTGLDPGQGFDVEVRFTADAAALEAATLRVLSNDPDRPTLDIPLRGVGTNADANGVVGGANEPSLQRILNAHLIPVNVGDGDGEATAAYQPNSSSEEVKMPRMRKAGSGPVMIEPLAVYGLRINPVVRFGTYSPGTKDAKTELFTVAQADHATVSPAFNGTLGFDPGGDFGLYGVFPGGGFEVNGLPRELFTEDVFNTWEPNAANRTKIRFFPLKNPNGSVVPDAYVFAVEEFAGTTPEAYDSNDVVGIIRNVRPAPAGAEIGLENLDGNPGLPGVPFPDRLVFSRIQIQPPATKRNPDGSTFQPPNNRVHDVAKVRVRNTGTSTLTINSFGITGPFELVNSPAAGTTIGVGGQLDLTVRFNATSGGLRTGELTINSNDADEPATRVQLAGYWQIASENHNGAEVEPSLQETIDVFGYETVIARPGEQLSRGGRIERVGDEVLSPYWKVADTSRAVSVRQLSAYHSQGDPARLFWFAQGSGTSNLLFTHEGVEGQTLLPHVESASDNSNTYAGANFKPGSSTVFGFRIEGEYSDPTRNDRTATDEGHHVRFWVARDRAGRIIPDTFVMAMDYSGINYDYNDNVYLVQNVKPTSAPKAPTGLTATGSTGGIFLNWADSPEPNVAGYNVYRSSSATGTFTKLNTAGLLTSSEFNDTAAAAGTTWHYRVEAVDSAGNVSPAATASAARSGTQQPPATPANLSAAAVSSAQVNLSWNASAAATKYRVQRRTAGGTFGEIAPNVTTTSYQDQSVSPSTSYEYRVIAENAAGPSGPSNVAAATTPAAPQALTSRDINSRPAGSTTVVTPGQDYDVVAGGENVFGTWDGFRFVYKQVSGDFDVRVRVASLGEVHPSTKAGIMARDSLAANSANVFAHASASDAFRLSYRPFTNAPTYLTKSGTVAYPNAWVRLKRSGNTFTGYYSTDGTNWATVRSTHWASAPDTVYLGLAASAVNAVDGRPTETTTAQFRSFGDVTPPPVSPSLTSLDINAAPAGGTTVLAEGRDYDVTAGGENVFGSADGFRFLYRQVSGDFDYRVRVASLTEVHASTKAGIMARTSLSADSANVYSYASASDGYRVSHRASTAAPTFITKAGTVTYPNAWVRLKRVGNVFTGYYSTDGVDWTTILSTTQSLPNTLFLGLAVSAVSTTQTTAAQFREFGSVA